ncbi:MAG: translation initiation factor IF-2 subunit gamma [Candidatus Micrarchaeaceae archaeon]
MRNQSELNIGTLGHVDHGKTTLTFAITHIWTDVHSESKKRSMSIKLGYADAVIRKCGDGEFPYTTKEDCGEGKKGEEVRRISLLDSPGHEMLMATAIAASNIIDCALFVIAANEPCPMPQTKEHLMVINAIGVKKAIVVQTKIDLVGKEKAKEHYGQIKSFLKGSLIEEAPIIPVLPNKEINIDALLEEIMKIPVPERDVGSDPFMYIARSFDVNRPGTKIEELKGGVIGGSIVKGKFRVGDEIEIRPGIEKKEGGSVKYEPIVTKIESMHAGDTELKEAIPGGLIAIGTGLDPYLTKADGLVGQVAGLVGKLPEQKNKIEISYSSLKRSDIPEQPFKKDEPIVIGVGTASVLGYVRAYKQKILEVECKRPICAYENTKVSIMRNISQRWKLYGYGTIN